MQRPRKRQAPEAHLVRQIITLINARGHRAAKIKTHGVWDSVSKAYRRDPNAWTGVPDILAFIPQLIFIEAKSPTGRQSYDQQEFERYCRTANIPYILARDISDIEAILK